MVTLLQRFLVVLTAIGVVALFSVTGDTARATTTDSTVYGSGNYGNCDYGSCTITLTSNGTVGVNVTPTATGKCTVQSDTASVTTDNTIGYTLTMTTSTTNNAMVNGGTNLSAASGTAASPTTLAMNTWGYRVDGVSGFGAGPTSSQNSGTIPAVTFAGVPASNAAATAVASSSSAANPAVNTTVWYGVCANTTIPAGTYSTTVTYTAVTN
jgi:hypothetical protein